jgi:hypothetical protein
MPPVVHFRPESASIKTTNGVIVLYDKFFSFVSKLKWENLRMKMEGGS